MHRGFAQSQEDIRNHLGGSFVLVFVNVVCDHNSDNDSDDCEDDKTKDEADPALLACCTSAIDSLIRISQALVEDH